MNSFYLVDTLAGQPTVVLTDAGGIDWLNAAGTGFEETTITLSWTVQNFVAASARATLWFGNSTRILEINGVIENVRGSNVIDWITGNTANNILYGDQAATGPGGNDTIFGDEGFDTVFGGAGDDEINGAEDADKLYGDAGRDTVSGAEGRDTVEGGAGGDSLSGGSEIGDTISYRSSLGGVSVTLEAGTFATVSGGHAAGDTVFGFSDVLGSDLQDFIIEDQNSGTIQQVNVFQGFAGNDVIGLGGGNDRGLGGDGADRLYGGTGRDVLSGGAGLDVLIGNAGADTMQGGGGADSFILFSGDSTASAMDTISDFSRGQGDDINLRAVDAVAGAGNQVFTWIGSAAFSAAGQLRVVDLGAYHLVLGSTDRDAQAEFSLRVEGTENLFRGDFIL